VVYVSGAAALCRRCAVLCCAVPSSAMGTCASGCVRQGAPAPHHPTGGPRLPVLTARCAAPPPPPPLPRHTTRATGPLWHE
jgi:hypothetical protein